MAMLDKDRFFITDVLNGKASLNYIADYIAQRKTDGTIENLYNDLNTHVIAMYAYGEQPKQMAIDVLHLVKIAKAEYEAIRHYDSEKLKDLAFVRSEIAKLSDEIKTSDEKANERRLLYANYINEFDEVIKKPYDIRTETEKAFITNYLKIDTDILTNDEREVKQIQINFLTGIIKQREAKYIKGLTERQKKGIERARELGYILNDLPPYRWNTRGLEFSRLKFGAVFVRYFWYNKAKEGEQYFENIHNTRQLYRNIFNGEEQRFKALFADIKH